MKKKLLTTILASVCAAACAFGLAACNKKMGKSHTEEQWKKALSTAASMSSPLHNYSLQQAEYEDGSENLIPLFDFGMDCDDTNATCLLEEYDNKETSRKRELIKKGSKYYKYYESEEYFDTYEEIRPEEYNQSKAICVSYAGDFKLIMKEMESRYEDFKVRDGSFGGYSGSFGYTDENGNLVEIRYTTYVAENFTFTVENDEFTAKKIEVSIVNGEEGEVCDLIVEHISKTGENKEYYFEYRDNRKNTVDVPEDLPEIVGKTFTLVDAKVSNSNYYDALIGDDEIDNAGKTVTCNADGTLTGDISFHGVSITTYTLTDDCGNFTVSNINNTQVPEQGRNTLVGRAEVTSYSSVTFKYSLVLKLTVKIQGEDVVVTYTFIGVAD